MSVVSLEEFVASGLHKEFPEVFLEDALHLFQSASPLTDLISYAEYLPSCIDGYHTSLLILTKYSDKLLAVISQLQSIQRTFELIQGVFEHNLPEQAPHFQLAAIAAVFPANIRTALKPFLKAYLLLELLDSERSNPAYNPFDEPLSCSLQAHTAQLELGRCVFATHSRLSLRFLLRDLWLPFLKSAFYHRMVNLISGVFTESFVQRLQEYLEFVIVRDWLRNIGIKANSASAALPPNLLFETYYSVRKQELFSIMIEYPESHPSLLDLRLCFQNAKLLQDLIDNLGHEVRTRLLHPGVHTDQILLGYGCLVRALRVIDPSSVAQDIICQPVAVCLRARDDAVHCIVDRLISPPEDTQQSSQAVGLQQELLLPTPLEVEPTDELREGDAHLFAHDPSGYVGIGSVPVDVDSEAGLPFSQTTEELDWDRWMPDPIEARHHTGLWRRKIDLLSLLVGIYGSKKAFLLEYRNLLSQRLLKMLSFDTDAQLRHLELLKRRFGETDMQECDAFCRCPTMSVVSLEEFVASGLHKEFPEVFLEDALHLFQSASPLTDLISYAEGLPSCIDGYHTSLLILTKYSDKLLAVISQLQSIQRTFELIQGVFEHNLPEQAPHFQLAAIAAVFPANIRTALKPFLKAYLLLELLDSERSNPAHNPFDEPPSCSLQAHTAHLELGRCVFATHSRLSLRFLLRDLWLPFLKSAFYHRMVNLISGVFTESFVQRLQEYLEFVIVRDWLRNIGIKANSASAAIPPNLLFETYYSVRKQELFSIMIEYPESHPSLLDLRLCFQNAKLLQDLIDELGHEVRTRLLHPGVHTDQILLGYGCLVRALRVIDPSSVAQDIICQPVAVCLRARDDAVHCIVDRLISPPEDTQQSSQAVGLQQELLLPTPLEVEPTDELREGDAHLFAHDPSGYVEIGSVPIDVDSEAGLPLSQTAEELDWDRWMPDPIEARHHTGLWRRKIDLLSLLVGIYGSKKAFLLEYRNLLSQRLLKMLSFDTDAQLRHLELLKRRFGETDMQECDVMLKDIRDSRRITNYVAEDLKRSDDVETQEEDCRTPNEYSAQFPLQAFILSGEYWPEFHREQFKLPSGLLKPFEHFTSRFEEVKGNRSVKWMHKLGLVNVDIERDGQPVTMDVSPLQAALLHLFTLKSRWTLCDLGQELEVTVSSIRRNLQPFVSLGILEEVVGAMGPPASTSVLETYRVCAHRPPAPLRSAITSGTGDSEACDAARPSEINLSISVDDVSRVVDVETSPVASSRETVNQELQRTVCDTVEASQVSRFEEVKGNRSVKWMHKLGLVNVDIERDGQPVTMDVSPLQAALLHLFTLKSRWTLCDLGQELEVTVSSIRRNLQPFVSLGILEEVVGAMGPPASTSVLETYRVCAHRPPAPLRSAITSATGESEACDAARPSEINLSISVDDVSRVVDVETSPVASSRETVNQELQVFWSYILGMLTNLGGLSLDRIHSMLRMFALGGMGEAGECTKQQLRHFLEGKLREGQLICEDDLYKLP
nr:unnamed protein product [Spirometra erinaceieuropaei]